MNAQMSWFFNWLVFLVLALPATVQAGIIFTDGFEAPRACWPDTPIVGRLDLCFDVPFEILPPVGTRSAEISTPKPTADLVIGMDTTGSMAGEIDNLKVSASNILDEFLSLAPGGAVGVVGYDDYPFAPYGSLAMGDRAFYVLHRVMTASTPEGRASIQNGINAYVTHGGGDGPESGWEMVFQVATGAGSGSGIYAVPPFDSETAPPGTVAQGEETGVAGGVGLRAGATPILMWITDEKNHNSRGQNLYGMIPGVTPGTSQQSLSAMNQIGGRIIGVMSGENARDDLTVAAIQTGAVVPPDAWGTTTRPAGCGSLKCCTGINGTGVTADQGLCPLVYEISANGSGLGTAIVDGIERLLANFSDIGARLVDDPGDGVDAVTAFVERLVADSAAPHPCTQGLTTVDTNADGWPDTFLGVETGSVVCFDVVLKTNQTVPSTGTPQYFSANLEILADGVTVLETRGVHFRVQP